MRKEVVAFTVEAHKDQERKYSGLPYYVHPIAVAGIVTQVTDDEDVISAALLHDVVEDTPVTIEQIADKFGGRVASLVAMVTDISRPEDGNRKVRKEIDRQHLAKASAEGQTIKLADLIDNSGSIIDCDPNFAKVYMKEKQACLYVLKRGNKWLQLRAQRIIDAYYSGSPVIDVDKMRGSEGEQEPETHIPNE